jgi:hypothetical protein
MYNFGKNAGTVYEEDEPYHPWEDGQYARERKGIFRRLYGILKFAVFVTPLALFLYGSFADCSARPAAGWLGMIGAGACARNEMLSSVLSMQNNFALLKRLID